MNFSTTPARRLLVPLVLVVTALVGPVAPSDAADPSPTTLTLTAPASGKAGLALPFTATLVDDAQAPIAGATVTLRRTSGTPVVVGSGTTDTAGRAVINAAVPAGTTTWQ